MTGDADTTYVFFIFFRVWSTDNRSAMPNTFPMTDSTALYLTPRSPLFPRFSLVSPELPPSPLLVPHYLSFFSTHGLYVVVNVDLILSTTTPLTLQNWLTKCLTLRLPSLTPWLLAASSLATLALCQSLGFFP